MAGEGLVECKCSRRGTEKTHVEKFSQETKGKGSSGITRNMWENSIKMEN